MSASIPKSTKSASKLGSSSLLLSSLSCGSSSRGGRTLERSDLPLSIFHWICYDFFSFSYILSHLSSTMFLFLLCSFPQGDHPLSTHLSIVLLSSYVSSLSLLSRHRTVPPLDYFSRSSHVFPNLPSSSMTFLGNP